MVARARAHASVYQQPFPPSPPPHAPPLLKEWNVVEDHLRPEKESLSRPRPGVLIEEIDAAADCPPRRTAGDPDAAPPLASAAGPELAAAVCSMAAATGDSSDSYVLVERRENTPPPPWEIALSISFPSELPHIFFAFCFSL